MTIKVFTAIFCYGLLVLCNKTFKMKFEITKQPKNVNNLLLIYNCLNTILVCNKIEVIMSISSSFASAAAPIQLLATRTTPAMDIAPLKKNLDELMYKSVMQCVCSLFSNFNENSTEFEKGLTNIYERFPQYKERIEQSHLFKAKVIPPSLQREVSVGPAELHEDCDIEQHVLQINIPSTNQTRSRLPQTPSLVLLRDLPLPPLSRAASEEELISEIAYQALSVSTLQRTQSLGIIADLTPQIATPR